MEHKGLKTALLSVTVLLSLCFPASAQSSCGSYAFTNNAVFATCSDLPALNSFLHWSYNSTTGTVNIAFRHRGTTSSNWVAWGLNPSGPQMPGTQAIIAFTNFSGQFHAYTTPLANTSPSLREGSLSFGVSRISASLVGDESIIFATLELPSDLVSTNHVWQVGPVSGGAPSIHSLNPENRRSVGSINFGSGQISGASEAGESRQRRRNIHGVLNAVSWGILMPLGVMMARYVKVFADPAWFYLHIACQASAYVIGVAGWATGIKLGEESPGAVYTTHRNIGITVFVFGTLQVFALLLRPKPDHKYRFYWNIYHHSIGYSIIILSIVNFFQGFDILNPDSKWRWTYIGILIFLGAVAVILEAVTWVVVLNRRKKNGGIPAANKSHGSSNGVANGATRTQQMV